MAGIKSSIYLTDSIRRKLKITPYGERGTSEAVSMVVSRYDKIMREAVRDIKDMFSEEELIECTNACLSTVLDDTPDTVLINIEDTYPEECLYPENKSFLEQKLRKLTMTQQFALLELIETRLANIGKKEN